LVYDNLDFMRGVEAFLNCVPGASAEAFRTGWATQGADNNQTLIVMEDLMDSKSLFLTPNTESIYHMAWLDVKNGPLVIETPPNVLESSIIIGSSMWAISATLALIKVREVSTCLYLRDMKV
jgi:hypothetical protein